MRQLATQKALEHSDTQGILLSKLLKDISSYYANLLSKCIGPIRKHLPPFVFVPRRKTRWKGEVNRSCCSTPSFTFDLSGDRQFVLGKFIEVELVLQLWEIIATHHRCTSVTCKPEKESLAFLLLKTVFVKFLKNF